MREPGRRAALALALGAAVALPARAQTPDQPNLIFTISGGLTTGGAIWSLPRQLVFAQQIGAQNQWDTVALGRKMRPGFLATLTATYFASPHLGYTLEVGFFGLESVAACTPVGPFTPTATNENAQACAYLHGENLRGDAVGLLPGLTYRFTTGNVQPYLRAGIGGAIIGSSFVEAFAPVLQSDGSESVVFFLSDPNQKQLTWMASLSAGVMLPLGPGYQLRMEARDLIVALPRPTGPAIDTGAVANASALPVPPIGTRVVHVPTFTFGLDIVLERRRGHRY